MKGNKNWSPQDLRFAPNSSIKHKFLLHLTVIFQIPSYWDIALM